jgi:thioredoxin 1
MPTTKVTDSSFDADVLGASGPVVVDYWAEWCGPSNEMAGKVTVAKLNIDENPQVPGKYGIRGIPTLMLFKDGKVASTKVGALPKNKLMEWIQSEI